MVVTTAGMVIRQHASDVRVAGRNTQGVRLIRLDAGDSVADVAVVVAEDEEERRVARETDTLGNKKPEKGKGNESTPEKERTNETKGKRKAQKRR